MNIEDIFPEIYNRLIEDKQDFSPATIAKNIYESPFFEYIKEKVCMIRAKVDNYNPKIENEGDIVRKFIYEDFLYHGSPSSAMGDFKYLQFEERSEPKDTTVFIHNYVNSLAKKKHGVNVRNGMFVTTQFDNAKSYGAPYLIFPLGEYKIFYSKGVQDFTDEFSTANHNEFGAHFTGYMLGHMMIELDEDKTFRSNVEESAFSFLGYVDGKLEDEQFKTFKGFKERVMEECEEYLKEVINNHDNFDKVLNTIKRTLGTVINNYLRNIQSYVEHIESTQDPSDLRKYEGMIFFNNAYAILMDSEFITDVFLELINLV
jgi:hypothetical protein